MRIVIITDGNNTLGMGHVYQSLTLAGFLAEKKQYRADISFITKSDDRVNDLIKGSNYDVKKCVNDLEIFDELEERQPDRIIFDKLDVAPELARRIREELKTRLIIFTNLTEANNFADVAILADYGSKFQNIFKKESNGRVVIFGPRYWLLRSEFYELKKKTRPAGQDIKNILLIFGGSDPCNLSTAVTENLLKADAEFNITLVLGAAFEHDKELTTALKENQSSPSKIEIVRNISNVAERMFNSDLVFASPGLSFFEALAVGAPVIGFYQNELQQQAYAGILPTYGAADAKDVAQMIKTRSFLYPHDKLIASMEIGEGKDEILETILH